MYLWVQQETEGALRNSLVGGGFNKSAVCQSIGRV